MAPAAEDWELSHVVPCFATGIVCLGLSAATFGKWQEHVGPRTSGLCAAALWGGGHLVAGAGLMCHSLPLLVFGYGVMGGTGLGLGAPCAHSLDLP